MAKGVSKELKKEIRSVLDEALNLPPNRPILLLNNTPDIKSDAINFLADLDVLRDETQGGNYRLTARGRDYWDELIAPRWYWFRRNWFPASVAGATIVAASVSAAANIVNLVI